MEKAPRTSDQYDVVSPELGTQLLQTVSTVVLSLLDLVNAIDTPQTREALKNLAAGSGPRSDSGIARKVRFAPSPSYETHVAPIKLAVDMAKPISKQLRPVFFQYIEAIEEAVAREASYEEIAFFFACLGFAKSNVKNVGIYLLAARREKRKASLTPNAPNAGLPSASASSQAPSGIAVTAPPSSGTAPGWPLTSERNKAAAGDRGFASFPLLPRPGPGEPAAALNAAETSLVLPNVEQPADRVATGASAGAKASLSPGYPFNMASKPPSGGQAGIPADINVTDGGPHPPHREASSPQSRVTSAPADLDDDDGFVDRSDRPYATPPHPLFARASRETHVDTTRPLYPTTTSNTDFVGSETSEADDGFGADLQPRRIGLARPPLTSPGTSSTVSPSGRAAAQLGAGSDARRPEGAGFRRSAAQPPPNRVPDDSDAQNDEDGPLPPRKPSQGEPP